MALLGHQGNCLSAPAEVSTWTKFCEIDVPEATLQMKKPEKELMIPYPLAQFEIHLAQPVKIHNIRKRMMSTIEYTVEAGGRQVAVVRDQGDDSSMKVDPIVLYAQSQHLYAEGPDFLLSDAIIFPCFYLLFNDCIDAWAHHLPRTAAWYDRASLLSLSTCREVISSSATAASLEVRKNAIMHWPKDVPNQSLYKSDPKRLNPSARIFTRQPDIDRAMAFTEDMDVLQAPAFDFASIFKIDWEALPPQVHPLGGHLPKKRLEKKCQQLENLVSAVMALYKKGDTIVDFCSGGGHLGILLAHLLPHATVYLVENKEQSLLRAIQRVEDLKMSNCRFYQGNMDYFKGSFDIGVSLHACGVATDLVVQACIRQKASFVCCPCCYGSVQANHMLSYPRSLKFSRLEFKDYLVLGHTADQTHGTNDKEAQGRRAMNIIDSDRVAMAVETGLYSRVELCQLDPASCSPKNNLIIGHRH